MIAAQRGVQAVFGTPQTRRSYPSFVALERDVRTASQSVSAVVTATASKCDVSTLAAATSNAVQFPSTERTA